MERQVAVVSEQGPRSYMEDRHVLRFDFGAPGCVFGGVYDGHGGAAVAEYAARHLHERFLSCLQSHPADQAFIRAYEAIADEIAAEVGEGTVGACAATFFIRRGTIYHANAGDARIITVGDGERQLTTDHRLDNLAERLRIDKHGGAIEGPYVCRGGYGVMPTRSLGDHFFRPVGVISTPSAGAYLIGEDDLFLIAATDGLFDVLDNREVGAQARAGETALTVAEALTEEVLYERGGNDNLTIIILDLRGGAGHGRG